jgi:hypothetical protein
LSGSAPLPHQGKSVPSEKQAVKDNENPDDEHEDRDPVYAVHIPDEVAGGRIRIFLFKIKIFSYLP